MINLREILEQHALWLQDRTQGKRADLSGAKLYGIDLSYANLSGADLTYADLSHADLRKANLSYANLSFANLHDANLSGANLSGAELNNAYLSGANLSGANLSGAELYNCTGNMREIKSLQLEKYCVAYTSEVIQIGCKQYPIQKWFSFSDKQIDKMESGALAWWYKWKDYIRQTIELSPARSTGAINNG